MIYNSPWAVAVLFWAFVLVSTGYLIHSVRLYLLARRLEAASSDSGLAQRVGALRRYTSGVLAQLLGLLLFISVLFAAVTHTLITPSRATFPRRQMSLRLRRGRLEAFDRFEILGSASFEERYRHEHPSALPNKSLQRSSPQLGAIEAWYPSGIATESP